MTDYLQNNLVGIVSAFISSLIIIVQPGLALYSIKSSNKLFSYELRYVVHPLRACMMLRQNPGLLDKAAANQELMIAEIESGSSVLLDQSQRTQAIFINGTQELSPALPELFKARIGWLARHGHLHEGLSRQDLQEKSSVASAVLAQAAKKPDADLYEIYYTDYDGNKDFTPMVGDDIWLVVKSRNMVGEVIDIDISDNGWDFEYQDKLVENHLLEDIKLTSDIEHIPLTITSSGPKILECYFTDAEGSLIEQPQVGEEVLFVFRTKNMIGKTVDIDLEDNLSDFEYQGEMLADDTLRNYQVNSGTEKIPLRVMPEGAAHG